ncbi:MAG: SulP family inorganic anion transporter, partial [Hyphomicrobiales bacterium]|nr:SulP family inorganic anion transporter [Hyphomicrobiales bacterium]
FLALIGGALGFALAGASRFVSVGADSTIAPIFAGGLAALAASGGPHYAALAAALALMVGAILVAAGLFKLGFVADLLSAPVTTGFLAGVSGHIAISQLPAALGIADPPGNLPQKAWALLTALPHANPWTVAIGFGTLGAMVLAERIDPRVPGALIALALSTLAEVAFGLAAKGVPPLGALSGGLPGLALPAVAMGDLAGLLPLALIVALVVMVQTAATSRSFPSGADGTSDVDRDFVGVGVANLATALIGGFPVDASPPRTAIVAETGGRTQGAGAFAGLATLALAALGAGLLHDVPKAALAGVLLFVAGRILRIGTMRDVWRTTGLEFALIVATAAAVLLLPIQEGAGVGIGLSMLHGLWTATRGRATPFVRIPGTTVWWPKGASSADAGGAEDADALVFGFEAPLSFLNADAFRASLEALLAARATPPKRVVWEATGVVDVDYTAAKTLAATVAALKARGVGFDVARLESPAAQDAFRRFGLMALVGEAHVFRSVAEALGEAGAGGMPGVR